MIICKTPMRISFVGGGTDMPSWIKENNKGQVISTSINRYGYIYFRELEKNFEYNFNIRYYLNEKIKLIKDIQHPVVKKCFNLYGINKRLKKCIHLTYDGDLPSKAGLGSSSSFTVGLINSIYKIKKKKIDKFNLAKQAINFEQNILKESVGSQDQVAAAFGGFNHIIFKKKSFLVNPIKPTDWKRKLLNENLMICLVGEKRFAHNLEKDKIRNFKQNLNIYYEINDITKKSLDLINSSKENNLIEFSKLINEYWFLKKKLNKKVSNEKIDYYIDKFKQIGADGCKLLGAGQGGFILVLANKSVKKKIKKKYFNLNFLDIKAEFNGSIFV